jgi:hypothetical protein
MYKLFFGYRVIHFEVLPLLVLPYLGLSSFSCHTPHIIALHFTIVFFLPLLFVRVGKVSSKPFQF